MPRYFFNVRDGKEVFDEVGIELRGFRELRVHMVSIAMELVEAAGSELHNFGEWEVEALDHTGKIAATMTFNVEGSEPDR